MPAGELRPKPFFILQRILKAVKSQHLLVKSFVTIKKYW